MDNDHLFVSFSQEALSVAIGSPPFHENIKEFAANLNEQTFSEFYERRCAWHWYPIITSGFLSFPVHGGLSEELTENGVSQAIGYAAAICACEDGKRFISALGLLSLLCRSVERPQAVPALTKHFLRIRESVTRNAIDPNIHYWFSKIALYQLDTGVVPEGYDGTFDRAGLNAPDKGWRGYGMSLDFPTVDDKGWQSCPGGEDAVRKEIEGIRGGDFVLEYQRSALHKGIKYWIWLYRNVSEHPVYHFYIYVMTTPDGRTTLHSRSMHSVVNLSPEELVAQHAFGIKDESIPKLVEIQGGVLKVVEI